MRAAYGEALVDAGEAVPELFVLDADCSTSTHTHHFAQRFPERFANVGIAEQNMVGMASGLAGVGLRPVVNSFAAMLVHRAHEQLMQSVGLPRADVLVVGHYAGLSSGVEGAPHHAISDIALMRAVPGMEIWWPYDDDDARRTTTQLTTASAPGPRYLRLERNPVAACPLPDRTTGAAHTWGPARPVAIVAAGGVMSGCLDAAREVPGVSVVGVSRIEPLDVDFLDAALGAAEVVITVEEHRGVGGLASALLDAQLIGGRRLVRHAVTGFTQTGTPAQLRQLSELDTASVARSAERELLALGVAAVH